MEMRIAPYIHPLYILRCSLEAHNPRCLTIEPGGPATLVDASQAVLKKGIESPLHPGKHPDLPFAEASSLERESFPALQCLKQ